MNIPENNLTELEQLTEQHDSRRRDLQNISSTNKEKHYSKWNSPISRKFLLSEFCRDAFRLKEASSSIILFSSLQDDTAIKEESRLFWEKLLFWL